MAAKQFCGWDVETSDRTGWVPCGNPAKALLADVASPADRLVCGVHARSARAAGHDVQPLPGPDVRVGQVWQDADPRSHARRLRVVAIDSTHAVVARIGWNGDDLGRRSWVRLDRFRPVSNGYQLITDAPEQEHP